MLFRSSHFSKSSSVWNFILFAREPLHFRGPRVGIKHWTKKLTFFKKLRNQSGGTWTLHPFRAGASYDASTFFFMGPRVGSHLGPKNTGQLTYPFSKSFILFAPTAKHFILFRRLGLPLHSFSRARTHCLVPKNTGQLTYPLSKSIILFA